MRGLPVDSQDYRALARRRLPRFLFDYVDGGAGAEQTMVANTAALRRVGIRQRVLVDASAVDTGTVLGGTPCSMPLALAPVGLAGMLARRGEVQALRAAQECGVPFTLSTVGICSFAELAATGAPFWFQLYMLRDRGVVGALLDAVWAAGCRTLVFTVDLPLPAPRRRDARNGLGAGGAQARRLRALQLLARPRWLVDVALCGQPLRFGCLEAHVPGARDLDAFKAWVDAQFDPTVTWRDLDAIRAQWRGTLLLKGILDEDDARAALDAGADGIVVSNHGGRQLDGAPASIDCLPGITRVVAQRAQVLMDGGVRSGADVFRALALGADGVLVGRPWAWALAAGGQQAVRDWLAQVQVELRATMMLAGVSRIHDISPAHLVRAPAFDPRDLP